MDAKPFRKLRKRRRIVKLTPPRRHALPLVTGGLNQLYENIRNRSEEVETDISLVSTPSDFTDEEGIFSPRDHMPLLAERYKYVEIIGQGQSSVLIKAKDTFKDDECVAIKVLHLKYAMLGNQETHCLASLNRADPYDFSGTLKILTTFMYADHYCMVFGYLEPKPLHHYFVKMKKAKDYALILKSIRKVTLHLLKSLGFLQQQNVIHADLKPDNILLQDGKDLATLKIVDFGNAIRCVHEELRLYYEDFELQTLLYRSPEVMFGVHFGVEIDMWSMGCILAELYTGSPIFYGRDKESILRKMISILGPVPMELFQRGKFYSELSHFTSASSKKSAAAGLTKALGPTADYNFVDFLVRLLQYDPAKRMIVAEAIKHPFLALEMPFKYMLPEESNGEKSGYNSIFLDKLSYKHGPYISQEIKNQHMSSTDLLSTGTGGAFPRKKISLPQEESNVRQIAQVTPLKRTPAPSDNIKLVPTYEIDLIDTQDMGNCPLESQAQIYRETTTTNSLHNVIREINGEEFQVGAGTNECPESYSNCSPLDSIQQGPTITNGKINGANIYKRTWKSAPQHFSPNQQEQSVVNCCDENRNVCSINPSQHSNISLPITVLNDNTSDNNIVPSMQQDCDIKKCKVDYNNVQQNLPGSPAPHSWQDVVANQIPTTPGHKIRRKLAKQSHSFNPSSTSEFPFSELEEFDIPEVKRKKAYDTKRRKGNDTFCPVLKGEGTFCNPSNGVIMHGHPSTSAEISKEVTTFCNDEEYRKTLRMTDNPKYGRVPQNLTLKINSPKGIPKFVDISSMPSERQKHCMIPLSSVSPEISFPASAETMVSNCWEQIPKNPMELPSDGSDRNSPVIVNVMSDDDKSNFSESSGSSKERFESTSSEDDVILLPSLDML